MHSGKNKLSIIIPAFNEEKTIGKVIEKIEKIKFPIKTEILVVDDGSTDSTGKIVENFKGVKLLKNEKNMGKGYSIRRGVKQCKGSIIVFQDADLEYDPRDIVNLVKPIIEGKNYIAYGSRFMKRENEMSSVYRLGNSILTTLTNVLFNSHLTDIETCYKVMNKDIFNRLKLKSNGFEIEAEITALLLKYGYRILELPIKYKARSKLEGKKIDIFDGIKTAFCLIRCKLFG
jgi:glycosyltransferase involved in cell wall biosynthesis